MLPRASNGRESLYAWSTKRSLSVLGSVEEQHVAMASGFNSAVARTGGLIATALLGAAPRAVPAFAGSGTIMVLGLPLARQSIAIVAIAALLIGGVQLLLQRTRLGMRLRAVAQDREMARALGMPVIGLILLSFALAAMLAAVAGLLLGQQYFATPTQGPGYMLKAYIAVAIGGWGSVPGALAGAVLIALFETFVSTVLSDAWAQGLLYVALLAILMLRPRGLLGEATGRRA